MVFQSINKSFRYAHCHYHLKVSCWWYNTSFKLKSLSQVPYMAVNESDTGDFIKKVLTATCALRDRQIVSIERVYTSSTFYMKSAVFNLLSQYKTITQGGGLSSTVFTSKLGHAVYLYKFRGIHEKGSGDIVSAVLCADEQLDSVYSVAQS